MATDLIDATPTEQVSCCSCQTRARIWRAMSAGRPNSPTAPDTSRKASSSDSGSMCGVNSAKIFMIAAEVAAVAPRSGVTTTSRGHSRWAIAIDMALRMPYFRAS